MVTLLAALPLVAFLLMLANVFLKKKKKNLVPEVKGSWPLFGHILLLRVPKPAHVVLGEMADRYGSIFMIRLGIRRAIVVSSWEIAKECLTINDRAFASRADSVAGEILGYNSSMLGFCPYGNFLRQSRKLIMHELLSNQRLEQFKEVRELEIKMASRELYKIWEVDRDDSRRVAVDMKRWIQDLTLNLIFTILFGQTLGYEQENTMGVWKSGLKEFFEIAGKFVVSDAIPFLRWLDIGNEEKSMKLVFEKLDLGAGELLKQHKEKRKTMNRVSGNEDFMDLLLSVFDKKPENVPDGRDPDTVIKATCLGLVLAGSDTTAITLCWALALLVNHPHVLKTAQQEIDNLVGKDRLVSEADTKKLVYLDCIIKETMRLYPAGPLSIPHFSTEDCSVSGYRVEAGTMVFFNISKIHRDPLVWSEADKFKPERFLELHKDKDVKGQSFEFIPFGSGRRMCPGVNFAMFVLRLTLASLIHGFDLASMSAIDMREGLGLTNVMAANLNLLLTPRLIPTAYGL